MLLPKVVSRASHVGAMSVVDVGGDVGAKGHVGVEALCGESRHTRWLRQRGGCGLRMQGWHNAMLTHGCGLPVAVAQ